MDVLETRIRPQSEEFRANHDHLKALALGLAMSLNAPFAPATFGVFRM